MVGQGPSGLDFESSIHDFSRELRELVYLDLSFDVG